MYNCKYFKLYELVPPSVYNERGERAWELLNEGMLRAIDRLRDRFGSCTINDWYWGGKYKESGLRDTNCYDYKKYSTHSFGLGFDLKFKNYDAEKVRKYILENPDEFPEIKGIEMGVSWLHIDGRNSNLRLFYP